MLVLAEAACFTYGTTERYQRGTARKPYASVLFLVTSPLARFLGASLECVMLLAGALGARKSAWIV